MATGTIKKPKLNTYSLLAATTLTTTATTYNTYNGRKFSDYDFYIFEIGAGANDVRATYEFTGATWVSGKTINCAVMHGMNTASKGTVTIAYNSDTSIRANCGESGAINNLRIFGVKLS